MNYCLGTQICAEAPASATRLGRQPHAANSPAFSQALLSDNLPGMEPVSGHMTPSQTPADESAAFLLPAVLAYFFLVLILLLRHEMWQDEWQAWLLATESPSLPELFRNLRYEGHPCLWHLGLFLLSRVTRHPLGMQLLHLLLAFSAVYLFLKYAPFTRLQKLLFILGYFPFYEYAVISRNYALGVLGLFSFCAIFCRSCPRNFLLLGLILFLLCQTSVYGLLLALALGGILFLAALRDPAAGTWQAMAALAIVLLGAGLSVLQLMPPADSGFAVGWKFDLDFPYLLQTLAAVWKSYVPLPALQYHFWGTNFINDPRWQALLSVIILACGILLFYRQPLPLFLYVAGTAGILAFTYSKYPGSLRHHGHLYLLFIACLWLSSALPDPGCGQGRGGSPGEGPPGPPQGFGPCPRTTIFQTLAGCCRANCSRVLTVLLAVHLVAGVWAGSLDFCYPFSESKQVAAFIKKEELDNALIVGHADDASSSVAGYLGRPLYYPARRGWGSFIVWNQARKPDLTPGELVEQARKLSRQQQKAVLLLLNHELPPGEFPVMPVQKFTRSLVPAENYYLYLLPASGPMAGE